jgi:hypothetical protein
MTLHATSRPRMIRKTVERLSEDQFSSWPGLSRPSTSFLLDGKDVDARHKAGHDE